MERKSKSQVRDEKMDACLPVHSKLEEFRREARHCDVTIVVDEKTFKCHRVILAAVSGYFDAMLDGRFVEGGMEELIINEIDAESFEAILQYAYTGRHPEINESNVLCLLQTSQFLQVQSTQELCIQYILSKKDIGAIRNVAEIPKFARATNIVSLIDALRKHMARNFVSFSQSNEFLEMPFDDLWEILNLSVLIETTSSPVFRNDDLFADSLVRWLSCDYEARKDYVKKLFSIMRSKNMSPEYVDFVNRYYEMQSCASEEWLCPKSGGTLCEPFTSTTPPPSYGEYQLSKGVLSLHLFIGDSIFSINQFKPNGFVIHPGNLDGVKSVVSDESSYLYFAKSVDHSQTFYAYPSVNISNSIPRILRPPPTYLSKGCAFHKPRNWIYYDSVKGSRNTASSADHSLFSEESVDFGIVCYNVEMDKWFPVPQTGYELSFHRSLVACDNLIYAIGLSRTQAYDYRSRTWLEVPANLFQRSTLACCSLNGKIYVDNGNDVTAFDPVAGKWETINARTKLDWTRIKGGCQNIIVPYNNQLWSFRAMAVYQDNFDGVPLYTEIYDPGTGDWHLPPHAFDVTANSIDFITVFKSD